MTAEERRLKENQDRSAHWRRWGPYLSERQWGTVREDYSPDGTAWEFFPHDHARSRAYRWGEDGLAGICDNHQRLCFALALWNERDPILKERLFGLTGNEGNHGEDVKEYYFYLDSTPTHSYMKWLYKYPQVAYPYADLVEENRRRDRKQPRVRAARHRGVRRRPLLRRRRRVRQGRGRRPADPHHRDQPRPRGRTPARAADALVPQHLVVGRRRGASAAARGGFAGRLARDRGRARHRGAAAGSAWRGRPSCSSRRTIRTSSGCGACRTPSAYVKDAFHDYVIGNRHEAVNPARVGTKAAAHYRLLIGAGETATICLRLTDAAPTRDPFGKAFDAMFAQRVHEADEFYARFSPKTISDDARGVMRQAFAGLLVEQAVLPSRRQALAGGRSDRAGAAAPGARPGAITSGRTSTTRTSSRCPTSGSTRGTPPGIWRST